VQVPTILKSPLDVDLKNNVVPKLSTKLSTGEELHWNKTENFALSEETILIQVALGRPVNSYNIDDNMISESFKSEDYYFDVLCCSRIKIREFDYIPMHKDFNNF